MKNISKKFGKWGLGAIITIVLGLIGSLTWFFIVPLLEHPIPPSVISSPSSNPIINYGNRADVVISATPDFQPPYVRKFTETITNDNPYKCYMVLEFKASDEFKFLPISETLPVNFSVEEGYEYQDTLKVSIDDFPSEFTYTIRLSIYTMNPDTYGGTENIGMTVLQVYRE